MANLVTSGPYVARNAEDITEGMIDYFVMMGSGVTDLSVGSVIRTEFEAVAQMAERFYVDQASALQDAIMQSAFSAFNFTAEPAEPATGHLVFYVPVALASQADFDAGTLWSPNGMGITYRTTVGFSIPVSTTGRWHVQAKCLILGSSGNLTGGAPGTLQYPHAGVTVYAEDGAVHAGDVVVSGGSTPLPLGFRNGQDPETPQEMRNRFTAFLSSLHRSTPTALAYGASLARIVNPDDGSILEQVKLARTIDVNVDSTLVPTEGFAKIYIFNGVGTPGGQVTTGALVAAAQDIIDGTFLRGIYTPGFKAAGIDTQVIKVDEYLTNISVTVKPVGYHTALAVSSAFLTTAVKTAVSNYISSLKIGDTFYLSALLQYIVSVPGVLSATITSLSISGPHGSTSSVGDFVTPSSGIVLLNSGQPVVTVTL